MKIGRFEDIEARQLARELARKVYCLTKKPGFAKDYGRIPPSASGPGDRGKQYPAFLTMGLIS